MISVYNQKPLIPENSLVTASHITYWIREAKKVNRAAAAFPPSHDYDRAWTLWKRGAKT